MERGFAGATIRVEARGEHAAHVEVSAGLDGLEIGRAQERDGRVVAHAPLWDRGYSGEQIDLENAYVRGIALALSGDDAPAHLTVGAPSIASLGFPDHPAALVALSTLAREAYERAPALSEITLLVDPADAPVFEAAFSEWSDTMLGT